MLASLQVKPQSTVAYKSFKLANSGHLALGAPNSKQILFSCTKDLINLSAFETLHTPVLVGVISKLPEAEWVLGVTLPDTECHAHGSQKEKAGPVEPGPSFPVSPSFLF